jgi:hypothetical protein
VCPHTTLGVEGISIFRGCIIDPELVTAIEAAHMLGRRPVTIRQWARRYQARQYDPSEHGMPDERAKYYDYADLATIDGCMRRGEAIPATPEERDQLRAELRTRWQDAA